MITDYPILISLPLFNLANSLAKRLLLNKIMASPPDLFVRQLDLLEIDSRLDILRPFCVPPSASAARAFLFILSRYQTYNGNPGRPTQVETTPGGYWLSAKNKENKRENQDNSANNVDRQNIDVFFMRLSACVT